MRLLCDSNVFLALTIEAHPHHARAFAWVKALPPVAQLAFCRATMLTYLRLLTTEAVMREEVMTNNEALRTYNKLRADPSIIYMEEPSGLEPWLLAFSHSTVPAPKRWMDAYLAAVAAASGTVLVTFDRGFSVYKGLSLQILN